MQPQTTYSRTDIIRYITAIRGKPYCQRHQQKLWADYRTQIGQMQFTPEQTAKILTRTIAFNLYPSLNIENVNDKITQSDIAEFKQYVGGLIAQIEQIGKIELHHKVSRDLNFLRDSLVGCGLRRYSIATLKDKVRDYLRETDSGIPRKFDYNHISGTILNGVMQREYTAMVSGHRTGGRCELNSDHIEVYLTAQSEQIRLRAIALTETLQVLESLGESVPDFKPEPKVMNHNSGLELSIKFIKSKMHSFGTDEDLIKLVCLKFITKYGKRGRRLLSLSTHPDTCRDFSDIYNIYRFNAERFQRILNLCAEFEDYELASEISRLKEVIGSRKRKRSVRPFHYSVKWNAYVQRRKSEGWHQCYTN